MSKEKLQLQKDLNHRIYVHSVNPNSVNDRTLITILKTLEFLVENVGKAPKLQPTKKQNPPKKKGTR